MERCGGGTRSKWLVKGWGKWRDEGKVVGEEEVRGRKRENMFSGEVGERY